MPRKLKDTELDNPTARLRLASRPEPYWRRVSRTCHLGYRRNKTGAGAWVGRFYSGEKYVKAGLGTADDDRTADGLAVLTFDQAQQAARQWFDGQERAAAGLPEQESGPYTVARCIADYMSWYAIHRKSLDTTRFAVEAHILPELGSREVSALTARQIKDWHQSLAAAPARLRVAKGQPVRTRSVAGPEDARPRKATANRVLTILKAALNHAYSEGLVSSDQAWRRVKAFRAVDAPKVRYLNQDEVIRLCNACEPDFRPLVEGALLTGCRYGELVGMKVGDFNRDAQAVYVRESKGNRARHVFLSPEGVGFFERETAGKQVREQMFLREDGEPWGRSHQSRRLDAACDSAGLENVSFHILRHTYASQLAMRSVPLSVIAQQLGHSDTRMTEKHYAHLASSFVADTVRAALPVFGIIEPSNAVHLPLARAAAAL